MTERETLQRYNRLVSIVSEDIAQDPLINDLPYVADAVKLLEQAKEKLEAAINSKTVKDIDQRYHCTK